MTVMRLSRLVESDGDCEDDTPAHSRATPVVCGIRRSPHPHSIRLRSIPRHPRLALKVKCRQIEAVARVLKSLAFAYVA